LCFSQRKNPVIQSAEDTRLLPAGQKAMNFPTATLFLAPRTPTDSRTLLILKQSLSKFVIGVPEAGSCCHCYTANDRFVINKQASITSSWIKKHTTLSIRILTALKIFPYE